MERCPICGKDGHDRSYHVPGVAQFTDAEKATAKANAAKANRGCLVLVAVVLGIAVVAVVAGLSTGSKSATSRPSVAPTVPSLTIRSTAPISAADKAAARSILLGSVTHYANEFATGQQIIGTTQYDSGAQGVNAFNDPNSAASRFAAYRKDPNPEADLSSDDAFKQADAYFNAGNEPQAISDWRDDMTQAQSDLSTWVNDAVSWQIKQIPTSQLQADAAAVTMDLATARADALKATS